MMAFRDAIGAMCALLLAAAALGCGADPSAGDAGPTDGGTGDAPPTSTLPAACRELEAPVATIANVPGTASGDLASADAVLVSPTACAERAAPFGVESAGPDEVIALTGLVAGTSYAIRLRSGDDLAFYVVTGCSSDDGPADDDCLLFVDAATDGREVGSFVAPATPVYVVVDYYDSQAPADGAFAVDVYPAICDADDASACGRDQPLCAELQCVSCVSDFDCTSPAAPVCDRDRGSCSAGPDACIGDDGGREGGDDGPAGATDVTPIVGDSRTLAGAICDVPAGELDYFAFTVAVDGESWQLSLSAADPTADLDLLVVDAAGRTMGLSYYARPELVTLTYLPAGTYYAFVDQFSPSAAAATTAYQLTATRESDTACTSAADCAADYETQLYRGVCEGGACRAIAGAGTLDVGDACDSQSDCATGRYCPSFFFAADADTRNVCGLPCDGDDDCAPMGDAFVCTDFFVDNFCYPRCTADEQCPAVPSVIATSPPWYRLSCHASGHCGL